MPSHPPADTAASRSGRITLALLLLLLASTLGVMAGSIVVPVLEVIRSDLGVSGTAAGLIITAHGLAIALSSPLMGRMIDRWGVRRPLAGGLLLYGIAGGAGMFVTSYPALIASRLVFGIGAAAVFTGTTVALLSLYRGPGQDRVMGWRTTATSLGGLIWPLLGGALGGISWHAPFGIYLVGIPIGVAALLVLPEETEADHSRQDRGAFRLLRWYPSLLTCYGLLVASAVFMYALAVFLPQRLAVLHIEEPLLVAVYSVVAAAATTSLVGLGYGTLSAKLGYRALLRTAAGAWVAAFLVLGTVSQPVLLLAAPVLFGLGQALAVPTLTILVGKRAPSHQRGQATSLTGTAVFAGQFLSPLLIGPLVGATSITTGFLAAGGVAGLILLALLVVNISGPDDDPGNARVVASQNVGAEHPRPTEHSGTEQP
ncbi:MFS transporter [Parasphingorhabdus pacifica]